MTIKVQTQTQGVVRELHSIASELGHAVLAAIEDRDQRLITLMQAYTPKGPGPRPGDELPHIYQSYESSRSAGSVAIISTHPGAVVHEFGGTVAPTGHPIVIAEAAMGARALAQTLPQIEESVEKRIDRLIS